ncbi:MAG: hypothetical protein ABIA93_03245 [Candidatus Woesearchaeota archaeon]
MHFVYSKHWLLKKKHRKTINEEDIEFAILHSRIIKDRRWYDVLNAITRVPPSGRTLKVVYKRIGNTYKILTAYWMD